MEATAQPPAGSKTASVQDSLIIPAIGKQWDSKKETMPAHSFGTGTRDVAAQKVWISKRHIARKAVVNSLGPIYNLPSTVGDTLSYSFGCDEQRKSTRAKYPDSSVDLTGAVVDSQAVKFHSTPCVHFGTEHRQSVKNAEIIRVNPSIMLGMESPGALEYHPHEKKLHKTEPHYSFGPPADRPLPKDNSRSIMQRTATPRHVGPGSHQLPPGIGSQPMSARTSAPAWTFGGGSSASREPMSARESRVDRTELLLDSAPTFSSLGQQVVSTCKTAACTAFGKSKRDASAKTHMLITPADRGPAGQMPKPQFKLDLPAPMRVPPKPGL